MGIKDVYAIIATEENVSDMWEAGRIALEATIKMVFKVEIM